jgi:HD-GYP domain-containing protein (c-di-GMP phosphodiesterase class II)
MEEITLFDLWELMQHLLMIRDDYTYNHCKDVYQICLLLSSSLKNSDYKRLFLEGAMIHDLGKALWPDIMFGNQKNTNRNVDTFIRRHPIDGALLYIAITELDSRIRSEFESIPLRMILCHHVKSDKNYPTNDELSTYFQNLREEFGYSMKFDPKRIEMIVNDYNKSNEGILYISRIIDLLRVADIFSALTGKRSYRSAFPLKAALFELEKMKKKKYLPTKAYKKFISRIF